MLAIRQKRSLAIDADFTCQDSAPISCFSLRLD